MTNNTFTLNNIDGAKIAIANHLGRHYNVKFATEYFNTVNLSSEHINYKNDPMGFFSKIEETIPETVKQLENNLIQLSNYEWRTQYRNSEEYIMLENYCETLHQALTKQQLSSAKRIVTSYKLFSKEDTYYSIEAVSLYKDFYHESINEHVVDRLGLNLEVSTVDDIAEGEIRIKSITKYAVHKGPMEELESLKLEPNMYTSELVHPVFQEVPYLVRSYVNGEKKWYKNDEEIEPFGYVKEFNINQHRYYL